MAFAFRPLLNSRPLLWTLLAVPAAHILYRFFAEDLLPDELVGPAGTWSARLIIFALMLTPLSMLLPRRPLITWLLSRRRAFGVAAFCYTLLHLGFYVAEMETLRNILAEFWALGIWTGWTALLFLLPLALTSNDASVRALGSAWKRLHRLAYPAALLVLVHWLFIHDGVMEAVIHFAPLALLEAFRLVHAVRTAAGRRPEVVGKPI